jgi:DNA repair protein REV1
MRARAHVHAQHTPGHTHAHARTRTYTPQELKRLVLQHGGGYEQYPTERVTHVIATTLSAATAKAERSRRAPPPIVNAAWLVDSIAAGRRLPLAPYLLEKLREPGQRAMTALLRPERSPPQLAAAAAAGESPVAEAPDGDADAGGAGADGAPSAAPSAAGALDAAHAHARAARLASSLLRDAPRSCADNPDFLHDYYAASRLHYIGDWRTRNAKLLTRLAGAGPEPAAPSASCERVIFHVDMDCFFAAVVARDAPQLRGVPLAVSHSASTTGTGEVSSASYEARACGVRAGQRIGDAKAACPALVVMPYDFEQFNAASEEVYTVLAAVSRRMQPVSVDEAYVDVTGLSADPEALAAMVRDAIRAATRGCEASVGIGPNKLIARLATRRAKPRGQFRVTAAQMPAFLAPMPIASLTGVGRSVEARLRAMRIASVGDLARAELQSLQREFGVVAGAKLASAAQGMDDAPVEAPGERESLGAECNWGVRFATRAQADAFLDGLAAELCERLREDGRCGRTLTLKAKRSRDITQEPYKFLGCGDCDSLSRSVSFQCALGGAAVTQLAAEAKLLLNALAIPPDHIRGLGLGLANLVAPPPSGGRAAQRPAIQPSVADAIARGGGGGGGGGGAARGLDYGVAAAAPHAPRAPPPPPPPDALASRRDYATLTLTQIGPETWAELPPDVQEELRAQLPPGARGAAAAATSAPASRHAPRRAPTAPRQPQHARGGGGGGGGGGGASGAAGVGAGVGTYADFPRQSQVDREVYAQLPPELQEECQRAWAAADRRTVFSSGGGDVVRSRAGVQQPLRPRPPPPPKPRAGGKGSRKGTKASAAAASAARARALQPARPHAPPRPPPKPPPPEPLCACVPLPELREALQACVLRTAALPDAAAAQDGLDAAAELLLLHCEAAVAAADLPAVRSALRFARRLAASAPAWAPHCARAVEGAQRAVAARHGTRLILADPGCAEEGAT